MNIAQRKKMMQQKGRGQSANMQVNPLAQVLFWEDIAMFYDNAVTKN